MGGLLEQFRERRVWRVLVAWPSVAFVLLQAIEFFINNYDLDARFLTAGMIVAVGLFPAGVVWNWRHGEAGRQPFAVAEVSAYVVLAAATMMATLWYWRVTPEIVEPVARQTMAAQSIVVLPFENASGNEELRYLTDGIAENLINWLSGFPDIRVVARTASFRFAESGAGIEKLQQEFGVDSAIYGRLELVGENLVVSASLTSLHDESQLWGEKLVRPLDEVIYLERSIVAAIKDSLQLEISGRQTSAAASGSTDNPEAYRRYLRGHHLIQATDVDSIGRGLDELREAIRVDPKFGQPYADIADALSQMMFYGIYDDPALMGEARNAAYSAVALAPELPESHTALATMHQYLTFDWAAVDEAYEAAIALEPQSPAPYHRYADFLWVTLRFDKGREMARRAIEIDPLDGSSMHAAGIVELFSGNFEEAVEAFGEWNRFHPESRWSYVKHAVALSKNGQCDESAAQIDAVEQLTGGKMYNLMNAWVGWAHKICGRDAQYEEKRDLIMASQSGHPESVDPIVINLYILDGEFDKAIELAWDVYESNSPVRMFLQVYFLDYIWSPGLAEVRQNPRFTALLQELDFPDPD
jgi:TolB-like protein/tetratricopeptide (TPR) repeat protein